MSTSEQQDFGLNEENFKMVDSSDFLGSKIGVSGGCEKEPTKKNSNTKTHNEQCCLILKNERRRRFLKYLTADASNGKMY